MQFGVNSRLFVCEIKFDAYFNLGIY
jgi:hypothetical protein